MSLKQVSPFARDKFRPLSLFPLRFRTEQASQHANSDSNSHPCKPFKPQVAVSQTLSFGPPYESPPTVYLRTGRTSATGFMGSCFSWRGCRVLDTSIRYQGELCRHALLISFRPRPPCVLTRIVFDHALIDQANISYWCPSILSLKRLGWIHRHFGSRLIPTSP